MNRRNYLKSVGASAIVPFTPLSTLSEREDEDGTAYIKDYGHTTLISTNTESNFLILEFSGRNRKVFLNSEEETNHIVHQRTDRVERAVSPNGELEILRSEMSGQPKAEYLREALEVDDVEYILFGVASEDVVHINRNIIWGKYDRLNFDEYTDELWVRHSLDVVNQDYDEGNTDERRIFTYPVGDDSFLEWIPNANRIRAYGETVDSEVNKIPVFRTAGGFI